MSDASVSVSRTIRASADTLWSMVSDLPRMGEWASENTGGKWVKGATGPKVGAKFKGANRKGAKRWSTDVTITECEPGRAFAFEVTAGAMKVARWGYTFESQTDGSTLVTESWTDRRNKLAAWISGLVVGVRDRAAHNRANMESTLAKLASAAE